MILLEHDKYSILTLSNVNKKFPRDGILSFSIVQFLIVSTDHPDCERLISPSLILETDSDGGIPPFFAKFTVHKAPKFSERMSFFLDISILLISSNIFSMLE